MKFRVDPKRRCVSMIPENAADQSSIDEFVTQMDAADMKIDISREKIEGKNTNVIGVIVFSPRATNN